MKHQHIELPVVCEGAADDLWRIDLAHQDGTTGYVDNVERLAAEDFMLDWTSQRLGGWVSFCSLCPNGPGSGCSHPNAARFRLTEITRARIMPMREAV